MLPVEFPQVVHDLLFDWRAIPVEDIAWKFILSEQLRQRCSRGRVKTGDMMQLYLVKEDLVSRFGMIGDRLASLPDAQSICPDPLPFKPCLGTDGVNLGTVLRSEKLLPAHIQARGEVAE